MINERKEINIVMRGSVVERNGRYSIVLYLGRGADGKKRQRWFSGYKSIREAEKALPRLMVKLQDGELIENNVHIVSGFFTEWLDKRIIKDNLAATTVDGYKNIINNHIIPTIGTYRLQELKTYDIQNYIDKKSLELSARTLDNHKRLLTSAFLYALDMGLIENNIISKVRFPRKIKSEIKPYTVDEAKELLEVVQTNKLLKMPVILALLLGLRRGECLGLRWSDVDFKNNKINIEQNLERVKGEFIFKDTKTQNSKRSLTAPSGLIELLIEHKKWQKEMILRSGGEWINEHNLVCTKIKSGLPLSPNQISSSFKVFLNDNKLRHIRFHDLRHTNATLMMLSKVSTRVAMQRLGHSDITITLGLYSHVLEEMDIGVADTFDGIFYDKKQTVHINDILP